MAALKEAAESPEAPDFPDAEADIGFRGLGL